MFYSLDCIKLYQLSTEIFSLKINQRKKIRFYFLIEDKINISLTYVCRLQWFGQPRKHFSILMILITQLSIEGFLAISHLFLSNDVQIKYLMEGVSMISIAESKSTSWGEATGNRGTGILPTSSVVYFHCFIKYQSEKV